MANNNKIERAAVRAVEEYIDECPKLEPLLSKNDKTPIYDGSIYLYKNYNHKIGNYYATLPVQVKGTNSTKDSYRIDREYIEVYRIDKGCIFFLVQEKIRPIKVLYAILTPAELNHLLQQKTKTIRIDLDVVPADPNVFESELFAFAAKRNGEKTEDSSPKEIAILVEGFEKMRGYIGEIKDEGVYYELETSLDIIKNTKDDGTIGWRDKFIYYSRKALYLATNHLMGHDFIDIHFQFGTYLFKQKQYHLVEDYYQYVLKTFRSRINDHSFSESFSSDLAFILNNLGTLHNELTNYKEAEKEHQEALEIYIKLAQNNPFVYDERVAITINNLALSHQNLNRFNDAEKEYNEALEIFRELAKSQPSKFYGYIAMTLNNLGLLHRDLNRFNDAEKEYNEALEIYRELAKSNPSKYDEYVANMLNNLANLLHDIKEYEAAIKEFGEALNIRLELAKNNPSAYLSGVATTLNNSALLHMDLSLFCEAEKELQEALRIRKGLSRENPSTYMPYVATTLNNLAVLHQRISRCEEAEKECKKALNIYRELAKINPDTYLPYVAMTLVNIARLHQNNMHKNEAVKSAKMALNIYKGLAQKYPQIWNEYAENTQRLLDELNDVEK